MGDGALMAHCLPAPMESLRRCRFGRPRNRFHLPEVAKFKAVAVAAAILEKAQQAEFEAPQAEKPCVRSGLARVPAVLIPVLFRRSA